MSRVLPFLAVSLVGTCLISCAGPDLGAAPFYCNQGSPSCPEGYVCVKHGAHKVCVHEGAAWNPAEPDSGQAVDPIKDRDAGVQPPPPPPRQDAGFTPKPDTAIKPDVTPPPPPKDAAPPPPPKDTGPAPDKGGGGTTCAHSPCKAGAALAETCAPGVAAVCATDFYCCFPLLGLWDASCVNAYNGPC